MLVWSHSSKYLKLLPPNEIVVIIILGSNLPHRLLAYKVILTLSLPQTNSQLQCLKALKLQNPISSVTGSITRNPVRGTSTFLGKRIFDKQKKSRQWGLPTFAYSHWSIVLPTPKPSQQFCANPTTVPSWIGVPAHNGPVARPVNVTKIY